MTLRLPFPFEIRKLNAISKVTGLEKAKLNTCLKVCGGPRRILQHNACPLALLLVHKRDTLVGISPWVRSESSTCHVGARCVLNIARCLSKSAQNARRYPCTKRSRTDVRSMSFEKITRLFNRFISSLVFRRLIT